MDIEAIKEFLNTDEGKQLIEEHDSVSGLRKKRDDLLSQLSGIKSKLNDYSSLGELDEIKSKLSNVVEVKDNKEKEDAKINAQIEHLTKQLESEKQLRSNREQAMVKSYLNAEVTKLITKHKGIPELLNHIVYGRVEASLDDNGNVVITTKTNDGQPFFKDGKEGTVEDVINEIKNNPIYGRAFEIDVASGSGARPQSKTTKPSVDLFDESVNLTDLMKKNSKR